MVSSSQRRPKATDNRPKPTQIKGAQKVFSEKASAIARMRQKCIKNASEMRQNGSCFIGKRGTSKMRQKSVKFASKMRQKYAEHLWGRTPFGRYRSKTDSKLTTFRISTGCLDLSSTELELRMPQESVPPDGIRVGLLLQGRQPLSSHGHVLRAIEHCAAKGVGKRGSAKKTTEK